jgi:putative ABC transport system permease protein
MTIVGFAFRNLQRRPLRTALSIFGIALAVGSVLALLALSYAIEDSTREGLDELGAELAVTQRGAPDLFGGFLSEDLGNRIRSISGVVRVAPELFMFAPSENDRHVLLAGRTGSGGAWQRVPLREGRPPMQGERRVVLIGDAVADAVGKQLDDTIDIMGEKFRIVGITKYASVVNRGMVVMPLADLQEVSYRNGQVTMFLVGLRPNLGAAEIDRIKREISGLGRVIVSTTREVLKDDRNLKTLNAVAAVISIIALAMSVLNVLNTMLMSIQERMREIGIMAAIGWSDTRIISSLLLEGLLMCAVGCAIGVLIGYLASFLFHAVPTIGDYIEFKPTLGLVVPTVLAAFALCALGALYPAWRAVRLPPAVALQRA